MTKKEIEELKEDWDSVCDRYLRSFCDKHGYLYEDDAWVGRDSGTIAEVADYFIGMDTIRYDIDSDAPEDVFLKWYDYTLITAELGLPKHINFESWCKGAPKPYSEDDLAKIREARALVREAEYNLKKCIDELNNKEF